MAVKKQQLIDDAIEDLKQSLVNKATAETDGVGGAEVGIGWESIIAILVPLALEWFQKCFKAPAAKKAAQIDDEMRRQEVLERNERRTGRKERRLHKKADKLFSHKDVIAANGGKELTDAQKDKAYVSLVKYAFVNRDDVAREVAS